MSTDLASFWVLDGQNCDRWNQSVHPEAPEHARLGTDGLYHPAIGGRLVCHGGSPERRRVRVVEGSAPVPLTEVPHNEQCSGGRAVWPGTFCGSKLGPLRSQLAAALGRGCVTCLNPWAAIIDHDHLTGSVRGYLCRNCNAHIDTCVHLSGCSYARYLANPPAAALELVHPAQAQYRRRPKYQARQRCFEIVMGGGTSPGYGMQPIWEPTPGSASREEPPWR